MSRSRTKRKHSWRVLTAFGAGLALLLLTGLLTQTSATAAPAGDGPPGFWWGTDSLPVTVPGPAPYITAHSSYKVGVYSSAGVWASIFGTGADSLIPHTYEWTYEPETTNYSGAYPYGWCLDHGAGPCAQFFGGQTSSSPYALMWQWSGGGGATNGIGGFNGDLDTIDAVRFP